MLFNRRTLLLAAVLSPLGTLFKIPTNEEANLTEQEIKDLGQPKIYDTYKCYKVYKSNIDILRKVVPELELFEEVWFCGDVLQVWKGLTITYAMYPMNRNGRRIQEYNHFKEPKRWVVCNDIYGVTYMKEVV